MDFRVLIVEDEPMLREELTAIAAESGYDAAGAETCAAALALAREWLPHLVLCDIALPDRNGLELMAELRAILPTTQFILITAFATLDTALRAFREGAVDFLLKPVDIAELLDKIDRLTTHRKAAESQTALRRSLSGTPTDKYLSGSSPAMQEVHRAISVLAGTKSTVLIRGETGTGKELVAREIHLQPPTAQGAFVPVNCAAIPDALFESELFGVVRGAFTGAIRDKPGLIERAHGGSVFLDEIGELPPLLQAKLLRVIEQKEVFRVGAGAATPVDVRFIAATNRSLADMVQAGSFREDLYYRLRVVEITVPPLRDRKADIPYLAAALLESVNRDLGKPVYGIANETMHALLAYDWPGNVRELRNALERALLYHTGGYLSLDHFPPEIQTLKNAQGGLSLKEAIRHFERQYIRSVLDRAGGNRDHAATLLGIDRSTLYRKLAD